MRTHAKCLRASAAFVRALPALARASDRGSAPHRYAAERADVAAYLRGLLPAGVDDSGEVHRARRPHRRWEGRRVMATSDVVTVYACGDCDQRASRGLPASCHRHPAGTYTANQRVLADRDEDAVNWPCQRPIDLGERGVFVPMGAAIAFARGRR
jgi:hypothetical protein